MFAKKFENFLWNLVSILNVVFFARNFDNVFRGFRHKIGLASDHVGQRVDLGRQFGNLRLELRQNLSLQLFLQKNQQQSFNIIINLTFYNSLIFQTEIDFQKQKFAKKKMLQPQRSLGKSEQWQVWKSKILVSILL